ncbi:MAG: carboxylating nicotinate-nucleotide diphosphorylase [Candidatus Aureabacteria bacterium]|nr:carboxylating nicotinate-nucleotide diphosphorylase [Candidatus Auribacterota bacterium]
MDFEPFRDLVRQALAEDIGQGDITTEALIAPGEQARAAMIAREDLVAAGLPLAGMVFKELNPHIRCETLVREGERAEKGRELMRVEGEARAILTGERTALNFVQRLCGIATLTSRVVERAGVKIAILDTRKTTPLLRALEKYAVAMGGGTNHRRGLYDAILVKDNHLAILARRGPGAVRRAVKICREKQPGREVEIEVKNLEELKEALRAGPEIKNLEELKEALRAGPEIILLDNFTPEEMERAVEISRGKAILEASGGVTLENIAAVAATGVERVSLGCLTHSAPAADISLEIDAANLE